MTMWILFAFVGLAAIGAILYFAFRSPPAQQNAGQPWQQPAQQAAPKPAVVNEGDDTAAIVGAVGTSLGAIMQGVGAILAAV